MGHLAKLTLENYTNDVSDCTAAMGSYKYKIDFGSHRFLSNKVNQFRFKFIN